MERMLRVIDKELYDAVMRGDVNILNDAKSREHQGANTYILSQTTQNNNIFHLAIRLSRDKFIEAALESLHGGVIDKLISQGNLDGNTPLHVAAEVNSFSIFKLLHDYEAEDRPDDMPKSWMVQNDKGNTPLHVALVHGRVEVAAFLVERHSELACVTNKSQETPLHLAIKHHVIDNLADPKSAKLAPKPETSTSQARMKDISLGNDSLGILTLLLDKDNIVACWRDANGLTPLLRAASLIAPFHIQAVKVILSYCPQSAEVCDLSGKTILHHLNRIQSYQEGEDLLRIPEIKSLINYQDHHGNTPSYVAVSNMDINLVRVLIKFSANFTIRNDEGVSAAALNEKQNVFLERGVPEAALVEGTLKFTKEECQAAKKANVKFLRKRLLTEGNDFLLSRAPEGGNILHYLMQAQLKRDSEQEFEDFIKEALKKFPDLLCQTDLYGNNPIHAFAIRHDQCYWSSVLDICNEYFTSAQNEAGTKSGVLYPSPWRMKNLQGNTPLHQALLHGNRECAGALMQLDKEVVGYMNNRKETPLHLLPQYRKDFPLTFEEEELAMSGIAAGAAVMRDEDGLTPLLLAARHHHYVIIELLYTHCRESAFIKDPNGKTFWHMLVNQTPPYSKLPDYYIQNVQTPLEAMVRDIIDNVREVALQLMCVDNDGNTALHLSFENGHFELAQLFLDPSPSTVQRVHHWQEQRLAQKNSKGVSPGDLIGSMQHLPSHFKKFLRSKGLFLGRRSLYGVPTRKIEAYTNTIGVTAALLATIAFTTAFTVPGGLNQENGTPILMRKAAFQIFMVSNSLAFCFSVMVLFCLLWVMTTAHQSESIALLDVSIFLLQASFYTTLLTFMMGVYVTTISIAPWIAILACALCSLLMLLMHKRLIIAYVVPCCARVMLLTARIATYLMGKVLCCVSGPRYKVLRYVQLIFGTKQRDQGDLEG